MGAYVPDANVPVVDDKPDRLDICMHDKRRTRCVTCGGREARQRALSAATCCDFCGEGTSHTYVWSKSSEGLRICNACQSYERRNKFLIPLKQRRASGRRAQKLNALQGRAQAGDAEPPFAIPAQG